MSNINIRGHSQVAIEDNNGNLWLHVDSSVCGGSGVFLTPAEAEDLAHAILEAADEVREYEGEQEIIEEVLRSLPGGEYRKPSEWAAAVANAGYRLVKDDEHYATQAGPPAPDGESGIGQSGTDVRSW